MSLFGAMNTAISGLTAQSSAFGNISDDVANSQTIGFKRVDTNFEDFLTQSTTTTNLSGAVVATPDYVNNVQGTITQSDNPLALAISGQGFFAASEADGQVSGSSTALPTFSAQQYYTRDGNFQMDKNGYLVNDAGEYLNGWSVDPSSGTVDQNALAPIQVSQSSYSPVATTEVNLSANLPATPAAGTGTAASPITSQVNIYDSLGSIHAVDLSWVQNSNGDWTVSVNSPDDQTSPAQTLSADLNFGTNGTAAGTPGSLTNPTAGVTASAYAVGKAATLNFNMNFGGGAQNITLGLGTYGEDNGVTQFAGTQYSLGGLTQNGVPPGAFNSLTTNNTGDVIVNYDNGQSRTIAQIPVVTFNAPDQLQRQNGQAFTATLASGTPTADQAGMNGAGGLVVSSTEGSNVDIATEFSALIVAQQAYSANTKVVTTANQMLQSTLNMIS